MPTVLTQRTVTRTNRSAGSGSPHQTIPIWTIKLVCCILSIVVLVLVLMQQTAVWQSWPRTIITVILTTGILLGWSLPSVLGRFLPFYRVDVALHTVIVGLTVLSLVLCIVFLIDQSDYSRAEYYKLMVATTICVAVETLICFILISWLCYGNYTIVDTH